MRIAIIETGEPAAPLRKQFGSYAEMMARMLGPRSPEFDFFTVGVFKLENLPPMDALDALLITGSPAGVYEDHDWIMPLEIYIRTAATARKPQVGICFGHQIMARAFGGQVEKSAKGWGVGVHRYEVQERAPWMRPELSQIACAVSHQDQVTAPPSGARVIAGSDFCPNGVLSYAQGPAISFQMHPEFDHEFATALLSSRKDRIARDLYDTATESLNGLSDRTAIAEWIKNFYLN